MANTNWSKLNRLQLGRYAEYYTKMEFASYGLDVFTTEVDDKGIDLVIKDRKGTFNEIQVKAVRNKGYVYVKQRNFDLDNKNLYLTLLIFKENQLPNIYLIDTGAWKKVNNSNNLFVIHNYGQDFKSEPEYGINISNKNIELLEDYKFENVIKTLM